MAEQAPDITAIITAHREGIISALSLHSLHRTVVVAREQGASVQTLAVLDRPNAATLDVFQERGGIIDAVHVVDFGDQGLARNHAIEQAIGEHVAFLDGDDLWSENWLADAWDFSRRQSKPVIAHPEFNWFFDGNNNIFVHTDQESDEFNVDFLRFYNYWDALCFAPRTAHRDSPYCRRDIKGGFAFEDWHWNCETIAAGYIHRVVPDTIHFKRRRAGSQTIEASSTRSLMRPTALTRYTYY